MLIAAYITREILKPFVLICLVLLLLMVSYSALVMFADASSNLIAGELLAVLILSKTIAAFELFLPLALYITLLMGLGKLYSDQEITALHAAGMSVFGIIRSLLPLMAGIALMTAIVAVFVRPWAYELRYSTRYQAAQTYDFDLLEAGYFYENEASGEVYFVRAIDAHTGVKNDLFIYKHAEDYVQVIYAAHASRRAANAGQPPATVFFDGSAQRFQHAADRLIDFKKLTVLEKYRNIAPLGFKRKAAATSVLAKSRQASQVAEYQWRITAGWKTFLLALAAILLARISPRQGRYGKLIIGILFFFAIHAASLVAKTWMEQGSLPALPGLWSIVIVLLISIVLLGRRYR